MLSKVLYKMHAGCIKKWWASFITCVAISLVSALEVRTLTVVSRESINQFCRRGGAHPFMT